MSEQDISSVPAPGETPPPQPSIPPSPEINMPKANIVPIPQIPLTPSPPASNPEIPNGNGQPTQDSTQPIVNQTPMRPSLPIPNLQPVRVASPTSNNSPENSRPPSAATRPLRDGPTVRFSNGPTLPSPQVSPSPSSDFESSSTSGSRPLLRSISLSEFYMSSSQPPLQTQVPIRPPPGPVRPVTPLLDFTPPEPAYLDDPETGKYGIRCVCGKGHSEGVLVQCDRCGFWLHGICVCIARSKGEAFYCPFCQGHAIRCKCGQNRAYNFPIVQCSQCKFWVHKKCEGLHFGIMPPTFVCSACHGGEFALPLVRLSENDQNIPNRTSFIDCNRIELLQPVPRGQFRNFLTSDLNRSELSLHETIGRYFYAFAQPIFDMNHEFWKLFVETMSSLLHCDKSMILMTLDAFAEALLYSPLPSKEPPGQTKFEYSESITNYIEGLSATRFELPPTAIDIVLGADRAVHVTKDVDDGQFICDLPGFLMHTDEMCADNGIPKTSLAVTDTDLLIDMEGTNFTLASNIKRSFHFNAIVKIYRIGDAPHVGIFATRMKGPVNEDKGRKGPAISADGVLSLPFDGDLPFTIPKCEWKDKITKQKPPKNPHTPAPRNPKKPKPRKSCDVHLSLMSAFCEDIIPPMPFVIYTPKDVGQPLSLPKTRARSHGHSEDE